MSCNLNYSWWILLTLCIFKSYVEGTLTLSPNEAKDYIPTFQTQFYANLSGCSSGSSVLFTWKYVSFPDAEKVLYILANRSMACTISGSIVLVENIYVFPHPLLTGNSFKLEVTTDNPALSAMSVGTITFPVRWTRGRIDSRNSFRDNVAAVGFVNNTCLTDGVLNPRYVYNCTSEGIFTLTIPPENMTLEEHFTWWRCYFIFASSATIYGSSFRQLSIRVPVRELNLSSSGIFIEEGRSVTISCQVNNDVNPVPTLQWSLDGYDLSSSAVVNLNTTYLSTLTFPIRRADQSKTIICAAVNTTFKASTKLTVYYPPAADETMTLSLSRQQLIDGDPDVLVTCRQPGGNPLCNLTLMCQGQHGTNINTAGAALSQLNVSVTKSLNGKSCTCRATHFVGTFIRNKELHFQVLYPPDVMVETKNQTEGDRNVSILCKPQGLPDVYTFHGWEHYYRGRKLRNSQDLQQFTNRGEVVLPTVTYQDQGTYVCLVDNGVIGRTNSLIQRGENYMDVKASAIFASNMKKYVGRYEKELNISVPVYSNPLPSGQTQLKWTNRDKEETILNTSARDSINTLPTNIEIPFFHSKIVVEGVMATWTISKFTEQYIGIYSLVVNNGIKEKRFDFSLDAAGPPEAPTSFSPIEIGTDSVTFHWVKKFDGGYPQSFYVIFNDSNSNGNETWTHSTSEIITRTITRLKPSTWYSFWLFVQNEVGRSAYATESPIVLQTKTLNSGNVGEISKQRFAITSYIGGLFSTVFVVVIVLIVMYLIRRRKSVKESEERRVYDGLGKRKADEGVYNELALSDNPKSILRDQARKRGDIRVCDNLGEQKAKEDVYDELDVKQNTKSASKKKEEEPTVYDNTLEIREK